MFKISCNFFFNKICKNKIYFYYFLSIVFQVKLNFSNQISNSKQKFDLTSKQISNRICRFEFDFDIKIKNLNLTLKQILNFTF